MKIFRSLFIVFLSAAVIVAGMRVVANMGASTVEAFGELTVDFHVPLNDPIFSLTNMAPGDPAVIRNVDVTNGGSVPRMVSVRGVRTGGNGTNPRLDKGLLMQISDGANVLYGAGGSKTVADFFADSASPDGIQLNVVNPGNTKTYTFTVTFPATAGNEYQGKSVIFDLTFGVITGNTVLINEVFYNPGTNQGAECPLERGVIGVNGNNATINIIGNGAGSTNSVTVTVPKTMACTVLQSNTTVVGTTVTAVSNTGNNKAKKNTTSTTTIRTGNASSNVTIVTQGSSNTISSAACSKALGQNDEWIELFNPTDHDISLKNYTLTDNSGIPVTIHANKKIKSGGFALLSKDNSTWNYWTEDPSAIKIPLGQDIGNGLENAGDRVILKNSNGAVQDQVSWGTDTSAFDPSVPTVTDGHSIERVAPGVDSDTAADWIDQALPSPGH